MVSNEKAKRKGCRSADINFQIKLQGREANKICAIPLHFVSTIMCVHVTAGGWYARYSCRRHIAFTLGTMYSTQHYNLYLKLLMVFPHFIDLTYFLPIHPF